MQMVNVMYLCPAFSCLAISCPAPWSVILMSCIFTSCIFSAPSRHITGVRRTDRPTGDKPILHYLNLFPCMHRAVKIESEYTWAMSQVRSQVIKRGRAQHIACPACANVTVHFLLTYRLATLLLPMK